MRPHGYDQPVTSAKATTPALIQWQSTRHLVAESGCSGKIHTKQSDRKLISLPACLARQWEDGMSVFPNRYLISRAAVSHQTKQVAWFCFHYTCSRRFLFPGMPFWRPWFFL